MYKILHPSYTVIETVEGLVHLIETVEGAPLWLLKKIYNIYSYTGKMTSIRNLLIHPLGWNVAMISHRKTYGALN